MLETPAVDESGSQEFSHLGAFLIGESGVEVIGSGILEVDLLVGDVHVTADHDSFARSQAGDIGPEVILPAHTVIQAAKAVLGIGDIDAYQIEILHLQGEHAAFMVVFIHADTASHG